MAEQFTDAPKRIDIPGSRISGGQQILRGLSTGLLGALQGLTASKVAEIARQRQAQGLVPLGFSEEEARGIASQPLDIQKEIVKDVYMAEREGRKASQKVVHDTLIAERAARDNVTRLDRIEQLDRTGKVQSGPVGSLLKKVGLGNLRSAETQELEKLSVDFLRDAKAVFGSRPTQYDIQQFQLALPSLLQSPEGRERVIKNLKAFNQAAILRGETTKKIIKENKNRAPANLELLVEESIGPQLDRLSKEIIGSSGNTKQATSFNELPNPQDLAGKQVRDTQTGQILQSNGSQWIPVG